MPNDLGIVRCTDHASPRAVSFWKVLQPKISHLRELDRPQLIPRPRALTGMVLSDSSAIPTIRQFCRIQRSVASISLDLDPFTHTVIGFRGLLDCLIVRSEILVESRTVRHRDPIEVHLVILASASWLERGTSSRLRLALSCESFARDYERDCTDQNKNHQYLHAGQLPDPG